MKERMENWLQAKVLRRRLLLAASVVGFAGTAYLIPSGTAYAPEGVTPTPAVTTPTLTAGPTVIRRVEPQPVNTPITEISTVLEDILP